ncbi:MAG: twin-arginine translocase TatA/TatE family subunit [Candidatus Omnitrophota bacterium]
MGRIGVQEILLILVVLLLIFGAPRLPQIARSLAESIKEFRKALMEKKDDKKA